MQNITYILASTASSLVKWIFLLHKVKDIKSSAKIFHRSAGSDLRNWISYDVTSVQRFLDTSHIATVQHCRTRLEMSIVMFQISCTAAFQGPSSHHLWITLTFLLSIPKIGEKRDDEKKLRKNMKWLCAQLEYTQFFKIKTTIGFQCFLDVVPYSCCPIFLSSPTTACFSWTFLVFYRWISNS